MSEGKVHERKGCTIAFTGGLARDFRASKKDSVSDYVREKLTTKLRTAMDIFTFSEGEKNQGPI